MEYFFFNFSKMIMKTLIVLCRKQKFAVSELDESVINSMWKMLLRFNILYTDKLSHQLTITPLFTAFVTSSKKNL